MRRRALLCLLALLLGCGTRDTEPPVRIVLITLDTLRYDSLFPAPGRESDMPHTRALAEGSLVFRRHYSATSTTQPTHASLFTGLHPWQHGVHRNGAVLDAELETLAESMQARGFETAAVVSSFPLHHRFGFDQGFDRFEDHFSEGERRRWSEVEVPGARFYSMADEVTRKALAVLDQARGRKQFFWFHYFDPHHPYGDSPGGDALDLVELKNGLLRRDADALERVALARRYYDRDVRHMDAALGRLYARILERADDFETHILVVSDHGESFGEQNSLGHGERLTSEQIHVPLLLHSPRAGPGTSDAQVGSVDVAATLDTLSGGTNLQGPGRDLTRLEKGVEGTPPVVGMRRTFAKPKEDVRTDGQIVLVEGLRFYVVLANREYTGNATEVVANDEEPVGPGVRDRVGALFRSFEAELAASDPTEVLDPETRAALEALGYVR